MKDVAFIGLLYYGFEVNHRARVSVIEKPSWWPEQSLHRHPIAKVYVCGRRLEPPLYSHVVNFPRLEVPLSGCYENRIEVGGVCTTVRLRPGAALFAPPNCWNLPTWRHRVRLLVLLFGKKQLGVSIVSADGARGPGPSAQKYSQPMPLAGPLPKILEAMSELGPESAAARAFPELAQALLHCVRDGIRQPAGEITPRARSLLEDICIYLQNHYQFDITRESVARQFDISPNYLSRVFQVEGHMTFSNYMMRVRTDRAKHLLRAYRLKLNDVAARCGYRDTSYFCRVFRKLTKLTPADYRAQQKALASPPA
jgi:AraC-like DNA-binding protein